jgi:hypothetical protein
VNPFAELSRQLVHRPGDVVPDPVRSERGRKGNETKRERRWPDVKNPWGLTGAEWASVNAMVASDGLHADVAQLLCVSPKTLSTHLMRARQKMHATSLLRMYLMFDRTIRKVA